MKPEPSHRVVSNASRCYHPRKQKFLASHIKIRESAHTLRVNPTFRNTFWRKKVLAKEEAVSWRWGLQVESPPNACLRPPHSPQPPVPAGPPRIRRTSPPSCSLVNSTPGTGFCESPEQGSWDSPPTGPCPAQEAPQPLHSLHIPHSVVSDSATPWTAQSMGFSRPECWSG